MNFDLTGCGQFLVHASVENINIEMLIKSKRLPALKTKICSTEIYRYTAYTCMCVQ